MTNEEDDEDEEETEETETETAGSQVIGYKMKIPISSSGLSLGGIIFLIAGIGIAGIGGFPTAIFAGLIAIGLIMPFVGMIKINKPYENTLILRLGKFNRISKEGIYLILPFVEQGYNIDMRVITTSFRAEKTLTKDNVPVNVESILFWNVADTKSAVLNVQDFGYSIMNASMVSLRQAISTSDLSEILTNRDKISKVVANTISQNAKRWGITVDNVEIKDIRIPDNLQNAMSQKAQASKEREARIIFADSEYQVAKKFKEAAKEYANSPEALQLRGMNMMYEGLKTGNSTIVIVPSSAVENMGFGGIMGTVQAKGLAKKKE